MAFPAWLATSVQVPAATSVKVLPLTVQTPGVLDAKLTASAEVELATSAAGVVPSVWLPGDTKVMLCAPAPTVKLFVTGVAAAKPALPAWLAVMEQLPAASSVAAVPLTVHTAGVAEAKETVKPEVAVATRARGAAPTDWLTGALKLMVCASGGAAGSLLPPQAASAMTATRAVPHERVFRTGWLIT